MREKFPASVITVISGSYTACVNCSMYKLIAALFVGSLISTASCSQSRSSSEKHVLSVQEFKEAMKAPDVLLIDVRTPQEYKSGHIAGSINVDWTAPNYEEQFAKLDSSKHLLLYCGIGGRSDQAREYLQDRGYRVQDLEDGIKAWKEAGMPVER